MTATTDELLDGAVAAARAGGAVLVEGLGRPLQVSHKNERTSIVTWADLTAHEAIVRVLGERFPDHAILGEEGDVALGDAAATWLVDPLDGTSNYAHGIPFACTSVAVRDAEGLAAGAILDPFRGELFTALRGWGSVAARRPPGRVGHRRARPVAGLHRHPIGRSGRDRRLRAAHGGALW
jgi:myo-inositol-1(or 4)-monophosphatase